MKRCDCAKMLSGVSELGHGLPLVSIVIPTYNHAHYLKDALDTVFAQRFQDWEAIIVNNYSEDNTVEVVESFKDPRIRLVNFHNNGIIAASRNEGIRLSAGEWVAFLDSDDKWSPDKLEQCIKKVTPDVSVIGHGLMIIRDGKPWTAAKAGTVKDISFRKLLLQGNCLAPSSTLVRKECLVAVGGFDESPIIVTSEDYDLWLKIAYAGYKFEAFPGILGEYRWHEGGASRAVSRILKAELAVVNKHFAEIDEAAFYLRLLRNRRIAGALYSAARGYHHAGHKREAIECYWQSIKQYPFLLKTYAGLIADLVQ